MRKIYSSILFSMHLFLFSQGENNHWYFGKYAAVNFNNPLTPQILTNSSMSVSFNPVGSISDSNGRLLFYSDGKSVWNREHQLMTNGSIINGVTIPGNQLAILKHPSNPSLYYIFNPVPYFNSSGAPTPGISNYSVIDMSGGPVSTGDGLPLGEFLTNYSSIPFTGPYENTFSAMNVSVVQHADRSSYWVLIPNGTNMYSYLVNGQGLVNYPVISNMPFPSANYNYTTGFQSYLKTSPILDNTYSFSNFVYLTYWGGVVPNYQKTRVMSFDNSTGMITPDYLMEIDYDPQASSSAEFSKDGSILYLAHNGNSSIYGLDMTGSTMPVNNYLLPVNSSNPVLEPNDIQRNKYGDIYISFINNNDYLAKILNPGNYNGANIDADNIYLNGRHVSYILPQLNQIYAVDYPCQADILLNSPEVNSNYTYQAASSVTTQANYSVGASQDIEMTAGASISLLPDTQIEGKFFAHIQDCPSTVTKINARNKHGRQVKLSLDLRSQNLKKGISISPNPATDFIRINSDDAVKAIQVFDMSGRNMHSILNGNQVDVSALASGAYLINIETKAGTTSKKFIKK